MKNYIMLHFKCWNFTLPFSALPVLHTQQYVFKSPSNQVHFICKHTLPTWAFLTSSDMLIGQQSLPPQRIIILLLRISDIETGDIHYTELGNIIFPITLKIADILDNYWNETSIYSYTAGIIEHRCCCFFFNINARYIQCIPFCSKKGSGIHIFSYLELCSSSSHNVRWLYYSTLSRAD